MLLEDRIDCLEKAIVNYYKDVGERRLGWTKLKNIKVTLDYTVEDQEQWPTEYFKELSRMADELKIPEGLRYPKKVKK